MLDSECRERTEMAESERRGVLIGGCGHRAPLVSASHSHAPGKASTSSFPPPQRSVALLLLRALPCTVPRDRNHWG